MFRFNRLIRLRTLAACAIAVLSCTAQAGTYNTAISITYSSGFKDVVDWHDDNLPLVETQEAIPIGATVRGIWIMDSGIRLDAGIGPLALILGDVSYTDIPLQLTIGYSMARGSSLSPYVRAGASYHNVSGDYVDDSSGGTIAAVGIEFGGSDKARFLLELSVDSAEATFSAGGPSTVIEIGGTQLTLGIMF